jgi:hypothetical protein
MTEKLTKETFARHLNTKFRVNLDLRQPVELELVEVKGYQNSAEEQGGMERFSAFFSGPSDVQLAQRTYPLQHEQMSELELFKEFKYGRSICRRNSHFPI